MTATKAWSMNNTTMGMPKAKQSMTKARGMGYIGGIIDTASGIARNATEYKLPDFSNVKKATLAY